MPHSLILVFLLALCAQTAHAYTDHEHESCEICLLIQSKYDTDKPDPHQTPFVWNVPEFVSSDCHITEYDASIWVDLNPRGPPANNLIS